MRRWYGIPPLQVIMDLSGWKTRAMLDRYNITSRRDLIEGLERAESGTNRSQTRDEHEDAESSEGA